MQFFQGFEKSDDGSHCNDVDECKNKNLQGGEMGTCTHLCTNSVGGYQRRVLEEILLYDITYILSGRTKKGAPHLNWYDSNSDKVPLWSRLDPNI